MLSRLQELLQYYLKLRLELLETDLKEQARDLLVKIIVALIYLFLASASLLLLFFGIAFYLNEILDSKFLGFVIQSILILGLLGIFMMPTVRKKCVRRLEKYFSEK